MGARAPIPSKMMNAAATDGAPPRRIKAVEIIICRFNMKRSSEFSSCILVAYRHHAYFHGLGVNRIGSCLFLMKMGTHGKSARVFFKGGKRSMLFPRLFIEQHFKVRRKDRFSHNADLLRNLLN